MAMPGAMTGAAPGPAGTDPRHALVLFSGGQDSTACLAWALDRYARVETLGFDYGQRHRIELDCRATVRDELARAFPRWAAKLGDDHLLDLSLLGQISDTALTAERAIEMQANGLPNTFVPGRNLLFLAFAATVAYRRGATVLVGGMCETDYSGYPDCRDNTMKAMQLALSLGLDAKLTVETPLMWLDKAQTWQLARSLLVAEDKLAAGEDAAFMTAKITTARFYAEHILSRAGGLRDAIVEGADSVTALALDAF